MNRTNHKAGVGERFIVEQARTTKTKYTSAESRPAFLGVCERRGAGRTR